MSKLTQRKILTLISLLIAVALILGACAPQPGNTNPPAGQTTEIKIAILPIVDALPMYAADRQGYFSANNIKVTFIPAGSAAERDQIIAAGQADGMINDLVSVALYNKQNTLVQTVRFAMVATTKMPMFRVLAAKDSGLTAPSDLAGVPVGMSQNTIIDYITSRLLEKEGLAPDQIQSLAVPKLPDRLALLAKGELKAATLPEPFGTIAQAGGAVLIIDDSKFPEYGSSVISFRKAFIDQNPQAVKGFLAAVDKASADINRAPEDFRAMLAENKMIPESIQSSYVIPEFPGASVPSEAQWKDVIDWMKTRQLIEKDLPYKESITAQYLSK